MSAAVQCKPTLYELVRRSWLNRCLGVSSSDTLSLGCYSQSWKTGSQRHAARGISAQALSLSASRQDWPGTPIRFPLESMGAPGLLQLAAQLPKTVLRGA